MMVKKSVTIRLSVVQAEVDPFGVLVAEALRRLPAAILDGTASYDCVGSIEMDGLTVEWEAAFEECPRQSVVS